MSMNIFWLFHFSLHSSIQKREDDNEVNDGDGEGCNSFLLDGAVCHLGKVDLAWYLQLSEEEEEEEEEGENELYLDA